MKKKRGLKINIKLSNRWLYFFITLGMMAIVSVGVYAATYTNSGAGHPITEISTCSANQIIKMNSAGTAWTCGSESETDPTWSGTASTSSDISRTGHVGIETGATSSANLYSYNLESYGLYGRTDTGRGVYGYSDSTGFGVYGLSVNGYGSYGYSYYNRGVYGHSGSGIGVYGRGSPGIYGYSSNGVGVYGYGRTYDFYAGGPGTNYGGSSSIRWKNNITEIPDALEKVMNIEGVYFNWDEEHGEGKHDMGFIAEDVGEYVPEVVGYDDATNESNWYVDENGNKKLYATAVDYGALTPLLVEAIKELKNENNELKSELCSKDDSYSWC